MTPLDSDPDRLTNLPEPQERLNYVLTVLLICSLGDFGQYTFFHWHWGTPFLPFVLHWLTPAEPIFLAVVFCSSYLGYPYWKKSALKAKRKRLAKQPHYTFSTEGVWPPAPKTQTNTQEQE